MCILLHEVILAVPWVVVCFARRERPNMLLHLLLYQQHWSGRDPRRGSSTRHTSVAPGEQGLDMSWTAGFENLNKIKELLLWQRKEKGLE